VKTSRIVEDVPIRAVSTDELRPGDLVVALYGENALDVMYLVLTKRQTTDGNGNDIFVITVLTSSATSCKVEVLIEPVGALFAFAGVVYAPDGTEKS
jgi:hypothetical protein